MAVSLAREPAEQPQHHTALEPKKNEDEEAIEVGDFVALVEPQSTLQEPKILLARVQALLPNRMAALLWFRAHGGGSLYSLHLDGTCWQESLDSLIPVDVKPAKSTKCLSSAHKP